MVYLPLPLAPSDFIKDVWALAKAVSGLCYMPIERPSIEYATNIVTRHLELKLGDKVFWNHAASRLFIDIPDFAKDVFFICSVGRLAKARTSHRHGPAYQLQRSNPMNEGRHPEQRSIALSSVRAVGRDVHNGGACNCSGLKFEACLSFLP